MASQLNMRYCSGNAVPKEVSTNSWKESNAKLRLKRFKKLLNPNSLDGINDKGREGGVCGCSCCGSGCWCCSMSCACCWAEEKTPSRSPAMPCRTSHSNAKLASINLLSLRVLSSFFGD